MDFAGMNQHDGEGDRRDRLTAVVLYDRAEAGRRAMGRLQELKALRGADLDLDVRLWRLDVAMDPQVAVIMARDLAGADLLILALEGNRQLEEGVRGVVEDAVRRMRSPGAAVALLSGGPEREPRGRDFLQQAAKEAGVVYLFPPACNVPAGTELAFDTIQGRATALTPVLDGILHDAHTPTHF